MFPPNRRCLSADARYYRTKNRNPNPRTRFTKHGDVLRQYHTTTLIPIYTPISIPRRALPTPGTPIALASSHRCTVPRFNFHRDQHATVCCPHTQPQFGCSCSRLRSLQTGGGWVSFVSQERTQNLTTQHTTIPKLINSFTTAPCHEQMTYILCSPCTAKTNAFVL